jgi:hypothetical protein
MAKITVYDPDGQAVEMEPVDARECCETCGYSLTPEKPDSEPQPDTTKRSRNG